MYNKKKNCIILNYLQKEEEEKKIISESYPIAKKKSFFLC
jgi:hypothetical protein